jgi:hypothetical protein
MNKYKLRKDLSIEHVGRTLYRIEALKGFNNVSVGDLGGYVEFESNLSQYNDCWIYDEARVYDNAWVDDSAVVYGNAEVYGNAVVYDSMIITKDPIYITGLPKHIIIITDNHVSVGCETHTFKHWIKHIEDIGKQHEYTEEDIQMYKLLVFQCIQKRTGKQLIKIGE